MSEDKTGATIAILMLIALAMGVLILVGRCQTFDHEIEMKKLELGCPKK